MAGIKVFVGLPRNPNVTPQYFHDHWRHPHGTWGLGIAGRRHYVQSHQITTSLLGERQGRFDGVVEVWFDCLDDAVNFNNDPVYSTKLAPDEPHFVDMGRVGFVIAEEEVIMAGPSLRNGSTADDCNWKEEIRPVSVKVLQFISIKDKDWARDDDLALGKAIGALRHVRCRPHGAVHATGAFAAGVRELWWPTLSAFENGVSKAQDAWQTLIGRSEKGVSLLATAERYL